MNQATYLPFTTDECYLGKGLDLKFDVSYVHNFYNKTAIDSLMHEDTFKLTILRDPVENFKSSWIYYSHITHELRELLQVEDKGNYTQEIDVFLKNPYKYLDEFNYDHSAWKFIHNPQFIFFGKPTYLLRNQRQQEKLVDRWIAEIDSDFDHVIILEMMFESLAVLMLKMCWTPSDMINLKMNSATLKSSGISQLTEQNLSRLNWADYKLYEHFKNKLYEDIHKLGTEKVSLAKMQIEELSRQWSDE